MLSNSYFNSDIKTFVEIEESIILGKLNQNHLFDSDLQQKFAWQHEIKILKEFLRTFEGQIFFEFSIPRMGKRVDVLLLIRSIVFVVEFKVGASTFDFSAIEQVQDYALDLKNFHKGSHFIPIVPILIATSAEKSRELNLTWDYDDIAHPICITKYDLSLVINEIIKIKGTRNLNPNDWCNSGYQPTPTIIEAAQTLYRDHNVTEISRSAADSQNLGKTSDRINEIIDYSKKFNRKSICFVTGVPGAGKTLAGLNIATNRVRMHAQEHAVFLSGNGPLVDVMREALARDQSLREGITKKDAYRKVSSFIQNIHHFRDEYLRDSNPPNEKVVIFDEAQRAWNKEQATKFMRQKRGQDEFDMSEPSFLISVMDRHTDWCVVICLIGGGQEINTGEAGIAEWVRVMGDKFIDWDAYISSRLDDSDYIWDAETSNILKKVKTKKEEALHLGVSMRSFRAESLSEFVGHLIENRLEQARSTYSKISSLYPIRLTRDINVAKSWLKKNARGSERYGIVASSGAYRLRPDGISMKSQIDAPVWFLNGKNDIRSSFYLEEVASEFDVQGLELDWTCVCWDADFRYNDNGWKHYNFKGTSWQNINSSEKRLYLKNAYRVLLTRARQGMIIFIPNGEDSDPTRPRAYYDQTFEYLNKIIFT